MLIHTILTIFDILWIVTNLDYKLAAVFLLEREAGISTRNLSLFAWDWVSFPHPREKGNCT